MKLTPTARELYDEIAELTIIDAHEHLPSEADYLAGQYCGPNAFASGYIWHDLESAGLDPAFKATLREPGERLVDDWWPKLRPHWSAIRHTSYSRALRITAKDLWGIDEINDETIHTLAERVRADNTPGLYQRVLGGLCKARAVLACGM